MGTTPSGLRYPEPTDPVAQGAAAIKNLATDADPRARGLLALTNLPGGADVTNSNMMTTSVVLATPRWICVYANVQFQQISVAAVAGGATIFINSVAATRLIFPPYTLNQFYNAAGAAYALLPAGTSSVYVNATVTAGAMRMTAGGQTFLAVEDLGKNF